MNTITIYIERASNKTRINTWLSTLENQKLAFSEMVRKWGKCHVSNMLMSNLCDFSLLYAEPL